MNKNHILQEIRRTADANGGVPLGKGRFLKETGIRESDWSGKFWTKWSDAVREAGYEPNAMQAPLEEAIVLEKLASLVRDLRHFPTWAEIQMRARTEDGFPSDKVFRQFGAKAGIASAVLTWCESNAGWTDVEAVCAPIAEMASEAENSTLAVEAPNGYVYLLKSGRYYKIGRSNSPGRREAELAIQLPESVKTVHTIRTDDPIGIEAYWHKRFKDRRKNGEWFELGKEDVSAFRRRKFM